MMPDGMKRLASPHEVGATINRLAAAACARGMTVFARIDHAAGAAGAGLAMRPTELLVFGSALAGTPVMQEVATAAIDLPLKALAWQDEQGATWLGFNDPAWIVHRHGISTDMDAPIGVMSTGLLAVVHEAIAVR